MEVVTSRSLYYKSSKVTGHGLRVEFTLEVRKIFQILVCKHEHASGVGLLEDTLSVIQRHGLISTTAAGDLKGWLHNKEGRTVREFAT